MSEVNSYQAVEIAAGRKLAPATQNNVRACFFKTPAAHSFANGDTMGTGIVLPAGARPLLVKASWGTGAASSTIDVGLRKTDAAKTVIDADALIAALAITTAGVSYPVTGAALTGGADFKTSVDAEVYVTFGGATPTANQQVAIYVEYIAP